MDSKGSSRGWTMARRVLHIPATGIVCLSFQVIRLVLGICGSLNQLKRKGTPLIKRHLGGNADKHHEEAMAHRPGTMQTEMKSINT